MEPSSAIFDSRELVDRPKIEAPWLERFVRASVNEIVGVIATTLELSARPWKSPNFALASDPPAHPLSYLLISLFGCTVLLDFSFAYFGRPVDADLIDWLTASLSAVDVSKVLAAAGPAFAVTLILAVMLSRAFVKAPLGINCPIVAAACFAVGSQLFLVRFTSVVEQQLNRLMLDSSHPESPSSPAYFEYAAMLIVCLTPAWQLERVAAHVGNRWLAIRSPTRWIVCTSFAAVMLFATGHVLVATNQTPGKMFSGATGEYLTDELRTLVADDAGVDNLGLTLQVDVISSETLDHTEGFAVYRNDGRAILKQTIVITNVGNSRAVLVPPRKLLFGLNRDEHLSAMVRESTIGRDDGGWVLDPGETRVAHWILDTHMVGDLNMCGYILRLPYYELSLPKPNFADRLLAPFDDAEEPREPLIALVTFRSETSDFGITEQVVPVAPDITPPNFQTPAISIEQDPWNPQLTDEGREGTSWR